jgi:hypothetical protein
LSKTSDKFVPIGNIKYFVHFLYFLAIIELFLLQNKVQKKNYNIAKNPNVSDQVGKR